MPYDSPQQMWDELQLFHGGYDEISLEFTVHLRGQDSLLLAGLRAQHTPTGEVLAITAFPFHGSVTEPAEAGLWLLAVLQEAQSRLSPFG